MNRSAVTTRLSVLALLSLGAAGVQAQAMVNARVLAAAPVYEAVPVNTCAPGRGSSGGGAAIGALTGGLIGSQIGKGAGHIAGAMLGALGGALLGNTVEAQQGGYYGGNCATGYQNQLTGYDVTYEWGGRQYRTRTAQAPGAWVQVPYPGGDPNGGYGAYGGAPQAQAYPAPMPQMGAYPIPPAIGEQSAGVVRAPVQPVYGGGYSAYPQQAYPQTYPQAYPQPVYAPAAYPAAPVMMAPAPMYRVPIGVSLSVGSGWGRHHGVGWGVSIGNGW
ncbi:MAG: glycine zipper 2TM domain-containing protein [Proteobacteria bacterium]|nr:glycine zipper 2TM domain-containing protein [Pseudomonadota bacterium]